MVQDFSYTPNFWTIVSAADRREIMAVKGGSKRLAILFERYQGVPLSRVQIQAIAKQDDFMKRIRSNQGARDLLRPQAIAILYSEIDRDLMHRLGLSFGYREFISFKPANEAEANILRQAGHID